MGFGEGGGKLFFRKVPSPFPKFPLLAQHVADAEDARLVEIPADELHADGEAVRFAHGEREAGEPGEVQGHGVDVHEVHLERIINDGAEFPRRDRRNGAEQGVAGAERVQVVLADEAADLRGLLVVGVVVPGGKDVGAEQDAALDFLPEALAAGTAVEVVEILGIGGAVAVAHAVEPGEVRAGFGHRYNIIGGDGVAGRVGQGYVHEFRAEVAGTVKGVLARLGDRAVQPFGHEFAGHAEAHAFEVGTGEVGVVVYGARR